MNKGKFVFALLVSLVNRYALDKCVSRYNGDYKVHDFSCWIQFLTMIFGQLTHRESIRDIITCLNAHQSEVYHLRIKTFWGTPVNAVNTQEWIAVCTY